MRNLTCELVIFPELGENYRYEVYLVNNYFYLIKIYEIIQKRKIIEIEFNIKRCLFWGIKTFDLERAKTKEVLKPWSKYMGYFELREIKNGERINLFTIDKDFVPIW